MSKEIPKQYNASEHEDSIYKMWEASGAFTPEAAKSIGRIAKSRNPKPSALSSKPFCIIMPPPNANGALHIGHAFEVALHDLLVRYHRMRGDKTLWLPGADHAGFETQVVYDKKLEKEGRNRFKIPREELWQEIWNFTQENKKTMEGQLRKLGASCDWSREKFTLDPDIIKTVYATFNQLYVDGLVYRDNRIVNWCTKHQTTLSDLEIKHVERKDPLYYIKYGPVTLATVRLETKFGDTAVAVHPKDKRYKNLIGKEIEIKTLLGLTKIKVIGDKAVDPEFGTGAVKVTPAHDPNDFEMWKRHEQEIPGPKSVIDQYGRMELVSRWPDNPAAKKYHGMKVLEARNAMEKDMQEQGLMNKIDSEYVHSVATCYKCGNIVEPRILPQWYVRMTAPPSAGNHKSQITNHKSLRDIAVEAVRKGEIKIIPKRFEKIFMHWMKNLRDWNISRQIVWGIRIPAWYRSTVPPLRVRGSEEGLRDVHNPPQSSHAFWEGETEIYVGAKPPKGEGWIQDPDVFDTWFSSGQWPFATLGYPHGKDFKEFYPTDVMGPAYEILFFWVARMIMLGLYRTGKIPFKTVFLHGLVRDKDRQKMSKSKGNVIDPLGVADLYGTDAVRMALVSGTAPGNDPTISEEKIKGYRNFANKIWNASRFVLMNLDPLFVIPSEVEESHMMKHGKRMAGQGVRSLTGVRDDIVLSAADKKILKELEAMAKKVTRHLDKFEFHLAGETLYHYFWHTFADKIIEQMKPRLQGETPPNLPSERGGNESLSPPARGGVRGGGSDRLTAQYILYTCLTTSLKLLHPFMPFVTEAVWQQLQHKKKTMLITESWPV
ncbi:valine--tRNA ligase [Candidatus Uhrbacteria bacterium]|nr:valine--tRNA ligase [Candidatus Uhrbacteria bacterium]